jgi:hypothetical protein
LSLFVNAGIKIFQIRKKCDWKYGLNSQISENTLETTILFIS